MLQGPRTSFSYTEILAAIDEFIKTHLHSRVAPAAREDRSRTSEVERYRSIGTLHPPMLRPAGAQSIGKERGKRIKHEFAEGEHEFACAATSVPQGKLDVRNTVVPPLLPNSDIVEMLTTR